MEPVVAYRGSHFLAADKPPGWLCVPGRQGAADARPCLGAILQQQVGARLWPVHRLDAEVSGLVLFATDAEAHRVANGWFETHTIKKVYEAFCEGELPPAHARQVRWESKLLRGKRRSYESPHGKLATTDARWLGAMGKLQHWHLEPLTGRPHQLRVHLAAAHQVVFGDALYGSTLPYHAGGIALRAVKLEFSACAEATSLGLPLFIEVSGLVAPL